MPTRAKVIPYLSIENLKNHTLSRGTYLYSPYMGVPPPPGSVQITEPDISFRFTFQIGLELFPAHSLESKCKAGIMIPMPGFYHYKARCIEFDLYQVFVVAHFLKPTL